MIQPITTLRDHNTVFQLPTPEHLKRKTPSQIIEEEDPEPTVELESARENYRSAVEGQKMTSIDDFLLSQPDKPVKDQELIGKNKKLARNAALIQVLDGIADTVHLGREQDEAIIAPSRYDKIGLSALDNLRNIDQEFKLDLNRFNQRKQQVEQFNKGVRRNANQFNKGIDVELARQDYQAQQAKYNQMLDEKEKNAITGDEKKEWHYQAGLRLITQGKLNEARAHFNEAGMKSGTIEAVVNEGRRGGSGSTIAGLELDPKTEALYEEYQHYNSQVSDDQYRKERDERGREYVDYSKPKPGTPAWHRDRLIEDMGKDFYLIDYARRPEREAMQRRLDEQKRNRASAQEVNQAPQTQRNMKQANNFFLQHAVDESLPEEARQQAKAQWLDNNRQVLLNDPDVPIDELDEVNEEMFEYSVSRMKQGPAPRRNQRQFTESKGLQGSTGAPAFAGIGRPNEYQAEQQEGRSTTKPSQRNRVPAHLRQTYDVGHKFLEQKQRMDRLREMNSNLDLSTGQREEQRLRKQFIERLDRIPKAQRRAVIDSLGYNPYEADNGR